MERNEKNNARQEKEQVDNDPIIDHQELRSSLEKDQDRFEEVLELIAHVKSNSDLHPAAVVDKKHLSELKALPKPPQMVKDAMQIMLLYHGIPFPKEDCWPVAKKEMLKFGFEQIDPEASFNPKNHAVIKKFVEKPDWTPESATSKSFALSYFVDYSIRIFNYHETTKALRIELSKLKEKIKASEYVLYGKKLKSKDSPKKKRQ